VFRLPFLLQDFDFHDPFSDAPVGLIKLALDGRAGLASSRATRSFRRAWRNPTYFRFLQYFTTPSSDTI